MSVITSEPVRDLVPHILAGVVTVCEYVDLKRLKAVEDDRRF